MLYTVLSELLSLEENSPIFEAFNTNDLLQALKNNEAYIIIKGDYKKEIKKIIDSQLSDTELLGLELGSSGTVGILAEIFYQLFNLFGNKDKQKNEIESKLRNYCLKINDDCGLILHLRHLNY